MLNIFAGLIFVFFKTNISFWDIGAIYYITNVIGYISILVGVNELGITNKRILRVRPYVILMIAHSIIFLLLNVTDNSPLTMSFSITALVGAAFIVAGMFMVYIIISELVKDLTSGKKEDLLYMLVSFMMLLFIVAGSVAFFDLIPKLVAILMGTLLLLQVLFLISYYYVFLSVKHNKKRSV